MHSWLLGPRKVRQPTIIRLFSAKTLCTLHGTATMRPPPTRTGSFAFTALIFLYCFIPLRVPALKTSPLCPLPFQAHT
jgi:hypothetical protein